MRNRRYVLDRVIRYLPRKVGQALPPVLMALRATKGDENQGRSVESSLHLYNWSHLVKRSRWQWGS